MRWIPFSGLGWWFFKILDRHYIHNKIKKSHTLHECTYIARHNQTSRTELHADRLRCGALDLWPCFLFYYLYICVIFRPSAKGAQGHISPGRAIGHWMRRGRGVGWVVKKIMMSEVGNIKQCVCVRMCVCACVWTSASTRHTSDSREKGVYNVACKQIISICLLCLGACNANKNQICN